MHEVVLLRWSLFGRLTFGGKRKEIGKFLEVLGEKGENGGKDGRDVREI